MIPNLVYTTPNASLHGRHYWHMEKNMIDIEGLKKAGMTPKEAGYRAVKFAKTLKEANMNYCEEQQLDALRKENEELRREIEKREKERIALEDENKKLKEEVDKMKEYRIKCAAYENVLDAIRMK